MTTDQDFTPPPLSFALMGHLITGAVKGVAIAVLLWASGLIGVAPDYSASAAIFAAIIAVVAVEIVTTLVERAFVLRHQHPDPGSVPMALVDALIPIPFGVLAGAVVTQTISGVIAALVVTVFVYWVALVALEQPWSEGDTQEDVRRKIDETEAMSREQFGD